MNKQLITLIGAAGTIGIFALGVLAFALPQWSDSEKTTAQAQNVANQNRTQQAVIAGLRQQEADMKSLDAEIAALRVQAPKNNMSEEVTLVASAAALITGAHVQSVTVAEAEPFTPRVSAEAAAAAAAAASANAPVAGEVTTTAPAGGAAAGGSATGQRQIEFTLTAAVPALDGGAQFVDLMRTAPRPMAILESSVTGSGAALVLTMKGLIFAAE